MERVDVQFIFSGFEIDISERLQPGNRQLREAHEHTPVARKAFEVRVAPVIEIRAHFLDLEIGHVVKAAG